MAAQLLSASRAGPVFSSRQSSMSGNKSGLQVRAQCATREGAPEGSTGHVVVVVGGAHSNNTRELVRTCGLRGARVYHVQRADDLQLSWFEGAENVGLTAGTSTPDGLIEGVEAQLKLWSSEESLRNNTHTEFAANL